MTEEFHTEDCRPYAYHYSAVMDDKDDAFSSFASPKLVHISTLHTLLSLFFFSFVHITCGGDEDSDVVMITMGSSKNFRNDATTDDDAEEMKGKGMEVKLCGMFSLSLSVRCV